MKPPDKVAALGDEAEDDTVSKEANAFAILDHSNGKKEGEREGKMSRPHDAASPSALL